MQIIWSYLVSWCSLRTTWTTLHFEESNWLRVTTTKWAQGTAWDSTCWHTKTQNECASFWFFDEPLAYSPGTTWPACTTFSCVWAVALPSVPSNTPAPLLTAQKLPMSRGKCSPKNTHTGLHSVHLLWSHFHFVGRTTWGSFRAPEDPLGSLITLEDPWGPF